jgi:sterol desaturase/sphingolipid hydroxylase (fatty acid hydroxylase superfamily)
MTDTASSQLDHETTVQIFIYAGLMIGLWLTEAVIISTNFKSKCVHALRNIKFIGTALPVQLVMTVPVLAVSAIVTGRHWGILSCSVFSKHQLIKMVVGFLILDFLDYVYHVSMHKFKPLWRFHLVHHTDNEMDVTTTVREHPGETFLRMCFLIVWILLTGAGAGLLLLRQTCETISNVTSHTSFRLAPKAEQLIGLLFVTPNIHHVHHHFELPYTDCNYGDVFSIWDRLFGTYKRLDKSDTRFGVDTHMDEAVVSNFIETIKIPFRNS